MPSMSNMAPFPVIVPMDINIKSDSKAKRLEKVAVEEVEWAAAKAQKKAEEAKMAQEEHQREQVAAIAMKEEAVQKAAELEVAELA